MIVTDDSGGQTDFPEIVTAGIVDGENENYHNINVDGSDKIRYTVIRCSGIQGWVCEKFTQEDPDTL